MLSEELSEEPSDELHDELSEDWPLPAALSGRYGSPPLGSTAASPLSTLSTVQAASAPKVTGTATQSSW